MAPSVVSVVVSPCIVDVHIAHSVSLAVMTYVDPNISKPFLCSVLGIPGMRPLEVRSRPVIEPVFSVFFVSLMLLRDWTRTVTVAVCRKRTHPPTSNAQGIWRALQLRWRGCNGRTLFRLQYIL